MAEGKKTTRKKPAKKKTKTNSVLREFISVSIYLLSVLVLVYLLITFVGQRTVVQGDSMEPALSNGDSLLVDKITYRFHQIQRFDIVVFPDAYEPDSYYIKRVIGLPGETVFINDEGSIFINGELLEESYGKDVITNPGLAANSVYLASDEYFVLGDNRNNSADSRDPTIGCVKKANIVGRAALRILPFSRKGKIR